MHSIVATLIFMYINVMALKRFPIGVQDFARIREDGMYYVDKTDLVYKLTHTDLYYFLSRPRRFGKSLLVSTLQYYFEGRKDLVILDATDARITTNPIIFRDICSIPFQAKSFINRRSPE